MATIEGVILLMCLSLASAYAVDINAYYRWTAPGRRRTDLYCDKFCKSAYSPEPGINDLTKTEEDCCNCNSIALWEIFVNESYNLKVEYTNRKGHSSAVRAETGAFQYLYLIHTEGVLSRFPSNICQFPEIVKINLTDNQIETIDNITCLYLLDSLILSKNKLKYIDNQTLIGLENLRKLDLSYNEIIHVEVGTLSRTELGVFDVNFEHNRLKKVDVSNFILKESFCRISLQNNKITEFINQGNVKLEDLSFRRGGFVSFRDNEFHTFPDFKKLGSTLDLVLGKLIHFGFDMTRNNWYCDGNMMPYILMLEKLTKFIWGNYMNIVCKQPPKLQGKDMKTILTEKSYDDFVTNLTPKDDCPRRCQCVSQPNKHRTLVNCSSKSIKEIPKFMPDGDRLEIDMSNNSIVSVPSRDYLNRTKRLLLSNNDIQDLSVEFLETIGTYSLFLDIHDNPELRKLHERFQDIRFCDIQFGNKTLDCACEDIWLQDWILSGDCNPQLSNLMCQTTSSLILASDIKNDCKEDNILYRVLIITFSISTLLTAGIFTLLYSYKSEIVILFKRFKRWDMDSIMKYKYDAYISMNENNMELRVWVSKYLVPNLTKCGYRMYCSLQSGELGNGLEEDVLRKVSLSRNVIVLLSSDYLAVDDWDQVCVRMAVEWRAAWNMFKTNKKFRLIIINFDQLRTSDIEKKQLRAFVRLRKTLDFSNRNHSLFKELKEALGERYRQTGLLNTKPIYKITDDS